MAQYQQTVKIRWHPFLLDNSITFCWLRIS
ncbi:MULTISPECIES: hypothetical protein [Brasilonema]|nr:MULTISPECIES: hypothetical protein [Brasilonema]